MRVKYSTDLEPRLSNITHTMKSVLRLRILLPFTVLLCAQASVSFAQDQSAPPAPSSTMVMSSVGKALLPNQVQVKVTSVTPTVVPPQDGSNKPSMAFYVVNFEYSGETFTTQLPYDPGEFLIIQPTPPAQDNSSNPNDTNASNADSNAPMQLPPSPVTSVAGLQPMYIVPPPDLYPYPYGFGGYFAAFPYRFGGGFYSGYYHGHWGHRSGFGGGGRGHGRR
jgi:hypothetical protein